LFSIAYVFISALVVFSVSGIPQNATALVIVQNTQYVIYSLIAQIIGGGILAEYFYKKYFPAEQYRYKSVWRPLAIILIITLAISLLR